MAEENDNDWMNQFMKVGKKDFMRWFRNQQGQFNPLISTLLNQARSSDPNKDFTVQAYQKLLGAQPKAEDIRAATGRGLENLAKYIQNIDVSRGAKGAADVVSGIGGALGIEGAGDVAQAVGTVSGVGAAGGDVFSKALMQGAAGRFRGLETEALSDLSSRIQELTLGAGQAKQSAKERRQSIFRDLAQARVQRRATMPNPLEMAMSFKAFQDAMKPKGSGYSLSSDDEEDTNGINPVGKYGMTNKELKKALSQAGWAQTTGLQGLMGNSRR